VNLYAGTPENELMGARVYATVIGLPGILLEVKPALRYEMGW